MEVTTLPGPSPPGVIPGRITPGRVTPGGVIPWAVPKRTPQRKREALVVRPIVLYILPTPTTPKAAPPIRSPHWYRPVDPPWAGLVPQPPYP